MKILGIETSCDETAAAVVADGRRILSNVVASQVDLHAAYGGVVPEIASRQHLLWIVPVVQRALAEAGLDWPAIDAVGVTYGPGLAGALLVGVNAAKALALGRGLPLVGVNHLEAHLYANWLLSDGAGADTPEPAMPLLCLIVSGAHSDLLLMRGHGEYKLLGRTRDDAAGEAFDKVARILGLGYPGGPAIQQAATGGNPAAFPFPRAWLKGSLDFSFSGLKTAVLRAVGQWGTGLGLRRPSDAVRRDIAAVDLPVADLAASFQRAVIDVLIHKTRLAAERYRVRQVAVGGGVGANKLLREEMRCRLEVPVFFPPPRLCTDNAAMVAACAYYRLKRGHRDGWDLDVEPNLELG